MTTTPTTGDIPQRLVSPATSLIGEEASINRWWRLFGALLMTLALGTLYAWSVFVAPLEKEFGWKRTQTSTVFTVAVVMFATSLLLAGKLQDRFGPFWISVTGSILITLGFFLFAHTSSLSFLFFSYGVLGGIGNGFGYGTVVPVMAKWFPDKMGLAIGVALAGYGGGSAVFGTLANLVLFPHFGWRTSCTILSGIFLVMTMSGAFLLRNPPTSKPTTTVNKSAPVTMTRHQFTPGEVLRMPTFYLLWFGFSLGSTAGLMVTSQLIPFARSQGIASAALATLGLVVGALGNVSGRILSGWISDSMGRLNTLRVFLAASAVAMPILYLVGANVIGIYALVFIVYVCYGAQSSLKASTVSDFWGTRYAGTNYGLLFTAWGFAGILGPIIGGVLFDKYKNYEIAFYSAAVLAGVAFFCVLAARRPSLPSEA